MTWGIGFLGPIKRVKSFNYSTYFQCASQKGEFLIIYHLTSACALDTPASLSTPPCSTSSTALPPVPPPPPLLLPHQTLPASRAHYPVCAGGRGHHQSLHLPALHPLPPPLPCLTRIYLLLRPIAQYVLVGVDITSVADQ